MRRKDREITAHAEILAIMQNCDVCSLALLDDQFPYVIPLNFGVSYDGGIFHLYFHCAAQGKKLELIRQNGHVAFEMSCNRTLILGDTACDATMDFDSVCGRGIIRILPEVETVSALTAIMAHYHSGHDYKFNAGHLRTVRGLELTVLDITGKRHQS
jgi:nitroimidazol reductase NimA-like FMN-containing flavoprotein (pyridoxamine 5'-phosphate oxidase superfamily)